MAHDDLKPEAEPPPMASLLYGAPPPIPVSVKTERKGSEYTINLYSHGELFDFEKYRTSIESFSLAQAAGEEYVPPIPLLEFPANIGGPDWAWTGTLSSEEDPHPAHATVTTRRDQIMIGEAEAGVVRVDVEMVIEPHGGEPAAERRLSFWFDNGHGLVKRQFGETSIRQPAVLPAK